MTTKTKANKTAAPKVATPVNETFENSNVAASAVPESISLQDLNLLLQIVDLASTRGAFRGTELVSVGTVFNKLNAFLSYVAEQQTQSQEQSQSEGE